MKIDLCDGKYTYIFDENTGVQEVWMYEIISGTGHVVHSEVADDFGLMCAMAHEINNLKYLLDKADPYGLKC
jgi:hypothetical protein